MFNNYIFEKMENLAVIKNYDKHPHVGKGRKPIGNLSVNVAKINELKQSDNPDLKVWGLVAYAGLMSEGAFGKKSVKELEEFVSKHSDDSTREKLHKVMLRAASVLHSEYTTRYKAV